MKPSTLESYEYASLLSNEYDYEVIPDSVHPTPPDFRSRSSLSSFFLCIPKSWVDSKKSILNNTPFATIILLLNNMIGSGILVQAFIFKKTGIIAAFFEYLIVGLMTYTGVHLMIRAAEHVQIFEYSELANEALGWGGAKLVDARLVYSVPYSSLQSD
jgi:Transmembrane amino acid transporter protein